DDGEEALDGRLAEALEGRRVDLVALAQDLLEELLLRREVVQQPGLAEAHGVGQFPHRRAAVAVAGDHVECGGEDLLALRDALRVRTPACHTCMLRTRCCKRKPSDIWFLPSPRRRGPRKDPT